MANSTKVLFCVLLGLCLVTVALSAAVEYVEPDMEANTMSEEGKEEAIPGEDEGEGEESSGDEMPAEEDHDGEGSGEEMEEASGEMEEMSGDMEDINTIEKIDDVTEDSVEKEDESSSSEEGETSSSEEEEPGMLQKCSNGIEGMATMLDAANGTSNKDCQMTQVLKSMVELLKTLSTDVSELKGQVAMSCSGRSAAGSKEGSSEESDEEGSGKSTEDMESSGDGSGDGEEKKEEEEEKSKCDKDEEDTTEGVMTTTMAPPTTPPPPSRCPPPFQLLAQSCYYIQTDRREWRSWGEAHAFCQQQGGTLASPYRAQDLRDYLVQSYSSSFWMGARLLDGEWLWMNGRPLEADDWRQGRPHKHPSQRCVYIDSFYGYKGSNYFCGEKFSFICEHKGE